MSTPHSLMSFVQCCARFTFQNVVTLKSILVRVIHCSIRLIFGFWKAMGTKLKRKLTWRICGRPIGVGVSMRAEISRRSVEDVCDHEPRAWRARLALVALHRHRQRAAANRRGACAPCRIQRGGVPPPLDRHAATSQRDTRRHLAVAADCNANRAVTATGSSHHHQHPPHRDADSHSLQQWLAAA